MDQLRRETQPPAGTPPSPVPQYWNPDADQYERVQGAHGAPRAILYGPNGQPISSANRLPVEATVTGEVSVTGTTVEIGGVQFRLVNGERLVGKASQRPSASAASAALFEGVYYHAHDTGELWQCTGSTWRFLGVA